MTENTPVFQADNPPPSPGGERRLARSGFVWLTYALMTVVLVGQFYLLACLDLH